jgi:hypothetical protein
MVNERIFEMIFFVVVLGFFFEVSLIVIIIVMIYLRMSRRRMRRGVIVRKEVHYDCVRIIVFFCSECLFIVQQVFDHMPNDFDCYLSPEINCCEKKIRKLRREKCGKLKKK